MTDTSHSQPLIRAATAARRRAHAPYSQFAVGAAILCDDGTIVTGCNVENASYGLSICAERSAACRAIDEGKVGMLAVAIAASPLAPPCGACRQFLAEFNPAMECIAVDPESGEEQVWSLNELLPAPFRKTDA